jgi:hypothetical protein
MPESESENFVQRYLQGSTPALPKPGQVKPIRVTDVVELAVEWWVPLPNIRLKYFRKKVSGADEHTSIEVLTLAEHEGLERFWAANGCLPPEGLTQDEVLPHMIAFEDWANRPAWSLVPIFDRRPRVIAIKKRAEAREIHTKQIDTLVRSGQLQALTDIGGAAQNATDPGTLLTAASALTYLKSAGVDVGQGEYQAVALPLDVSNPPDDANVSAKPVSRWAAQETAILQKLKELDYDPQALPQHKAGKAGVKAAVKKALGAKGLWAHPSVFDKAWKRLSDNGDIKKTD